MNKFLKIIGVVSAVSAITLSVAACTAPHKHNWIWKRTETEHWLECACGETKERAEHLEDHEGNLCRDCAEFRAIGIGFVQGGDAAHADFAREANEWFAAKGKELN